MKKAILSLAFVLAIGISFISANNINIVDPYGDCTQESLDNYEWFMGFTGDPDLSFELSEDILSECLDMADILAG
ncbi:hypothetical protein [Polaribacter sp. R77954]|uniref:hypothetical protein n=1 Tax=Polaribacter sp. R77954 TaxID=3093870 RepID=UPI0037C60CF1